jgi:hypothetical protein
MNLIELNEQMAPEMTDEEFQQLQEEIKATIIKLRALQAAYRQQTGRDYIPS